MIFLVLHVHAPKAVAQILTPCAELAVAAEVGMKGKIAVLARWTMSALVTPFALKAVTEIAACLVTVGFYAEETIFQSERIVTAVAVFAFRKVIADAIFAAELMDA